MSSKQTPSDHVSQLLLLTEKEKQEEIDSRAILTSNLPGSVLQRHGLALLALRISSSKTGLGGKTIVNLESGDTGTKFPHNQFRTGDVVALTPQGGATKKKSEKAEEASGVVLKVTDYKLVVALDDASLIFDSLSGFWRVTQRANEITYKRMIRVLHDMLFHIQPSPKSLDKASKPSWVGNPDLLSLLLCSSKSRLCSDSSVTVESIQFFDPLLNPSQQEAVRHALSAQHISLIHGPPGTGKTHTLVELILQLVKRELRVLVCGPSNASVDNILERLVSKGIQCLRVGHPGRVQNKLTEHVLDIRLRNCDAGQIVREIRTEMDQVLASIEKCKSRKERRELYDSLKDLRRDFRTREAKATSEVINTSQVVLSTLSGVGGRVLRDLPAFDIVVIDEATQALEAECWIAIARSHKVILAGDHHQLPPTVISGEEALETTLFQRLLDFYGRNIVRMLNVQYRMHSDIMTFSGDHLYRSKLTAHPSVASHLLRDLPHVEDGDLTSLPLVFLDTAGSDLYESTEDDEYGLANSSKWNAGEVQLVVAHVKQLIECGVKPFDIAIISPYNAQVAQLKSELNSLYPGMEIGSVDGFQGREKEAVIVSLVRSNGEREIGFLKDYRRLNVAITRARRHLCLVGDSDTVMAGRASSEVSKSSKTTKSSAKTEESKKSSDAPLEQDKNTKITQSERLKTSPKSEQKITQADDLEAKQKTPVTESNVKTDTNHFEDFLPALGRYLNEHADLWVPEMYM